MEIIEIYTDGSSLGNPGQSGIGVVLKYKDTVKRISKNIGIGTNNIAELTAIKVALENILDKSIPITIYTDSQYALGVLTKSWKPKQNIELINEIKKLMSQFVSINIIHVYGHRGHPENEMANSLAISGAKKK